MKFRPILIICLGIFLSLNAYAQSVQLTGRVIDEQGLPIGNVSIKNENSNQATSTGENGTFSIAYTGRTSFAFSAIGYVPQNITLENQPNVTVTLVGENQTLNEVVVVGYGTQRKGDITGSVASVKSADFVKGPVRDAAQLIQGKVAGLTITNSSGDPNQNTMIQLRGLGTLSGNPNPLILIDGIPGSVNTVAPEDIESIDVLKDGSAAAIYGTRGSNGVILITTKKSRGDLRGTVNYSGYVSTEAIANRPSFYTADDYRRLIKEGVKLEDMGTSTDWFKEITRTPVSHTHNLTLSGGSSTTNYTASLNYRDMQGIFLKSNNKQFTGRVDLNHSMFENKVKITLNAISKNRNYDNFSNYAYRQSVIRNPTDSVQNNGKWVERNIYFYDNPLAYIRESDGQNLEKDIRLNGSITYSPINDLNIKLLVSGNKFSVTNGYAETKQHVSNTKNNRNGYASIGTSFNKDNLLELTADYSKSINEHKFTLLGGYSQQYVKSEGFSMTNWDFPTDVYSWNRMQSGNALGRGEAAMTSFANSYRLLGGFARANYSYKDKYILMASVRQEGSSRFGANHKWGTFPGVSAAWRLSEESFVKNISFFNDLKLRAGFGVTGISPTNSYLSLTSLNYGSRFLDNGKWIQSLSPVRNPNPDLRWEKKEEFNFGLDFTVFNNKLSGNIDLYRRQTKDMLWQYQVPVPPYLYSQILANVGTIENKGLEIILNYNAVRNENFLWTTSANFSTNSNKLVSLSNDLFQTTNDFFDAGHTGEPVQESTHRVKIGGPIGNFYGYKSVDIDAEGHWIVENKNGEAIPIANSSTDDKHVLGNGLPKYYVGWNNALKYKNWDMSIAVRGVFGFQILNFQRMYYENPKILYNQLTTSRDLVYGKAMLDSDQAYVSYYIEDGDYVKIDNVTLGYTLPIKQGKYFREARFYASGLNLLTITGYKGIDPEVGYRDEGGSFLAPGNDARDKYPTTRTFTFGVNLTF